jgi:hypothetical protein
MRWLVEQATQGETHAMPARQLVSGDRVKGE